MFRRLLIWLYAISLATGAALCLWGIAVTISNHGTEPAWLSISRGGSCTAALVVTVAFGLTWLKRGVRPLALPLFGLSFLAIQGVFDEALRAYMKNWAPASPAVARIANFVALAIVVGVSLAVAYAVKLSEKQTRGN